MSALDSIESAERILNQWLVDNTDELFEESPKIDEARGLLIEAIEKLRSPGGDRDRSAGRR